MPSSTEFGRDAFGVVIQGFQRALGAFVARGVRRFGQGVDALEAGLQGDATAATFMQVRGAVVFPALLLFFSQRLWMVARAVAEQQLFQPAVVEGHLLGGQLRRRQRQQTLQGAAVVVANEAAVKVFVHIGRFARRGALEDRRPQMLQLRAQRRGMLGMQQGQRHVQAPSVCGIASVFRLP